MEGSGYKLGIYGPKPVCKYIRGTYSATERLDKAAMLICSKALGHNRISVVADNYIRGL